MYVGNNPLAYLDPTGMELVRLGQHTDEQINNRVGEIDAELKKEGITDKQKQGLQSERNTLQIEQEGNRVVGELLKNLDAAGERQGLQVSNFTVSTDPKSDFKSMTEKRGYKGKALEKELNESAGAIATVFRGQSTQIFINGTNPYYKAVSQGAGLIYPGYGQIDAKDVATITSTYLPHERYHRDIGPSERRAYQEQLRVLNKFGPGAFVNQKVFADTQRIFTGGAKTGRLSPIK